MIKQSYLAVKNLMFTFKKGNKPFFDDVSITLQPHTFNFIQGKNGIGKSTLLRILQGNVLSGEQVSGTFSIDDAVYDLNHIQTLPNQIAMVAQNFNAMLVDHYLFKENLQCALIDRFPGLQRLPQSKEIPQFIAKYGINYEIPISLLSGGQRQILSILMTLQRSPKILFLDEPTATLDEENTELIMNFLAELCSSEQITIILIVHNKEIVQKYCPGMYFEFKKDAGGKRIIAPIELRSNMSL